MVKDKDIKVKVSLECTIFGQNENGVTMEVPVVSRYAIKRLQLYT
ncbi:unnamed protein product [Spirodela intermedia]|uniref:Uncharacterized protein n=1 Tax=Spirodela intermedia TaxID=51605 RepID=A0A7I8J4A0_SPIIN|nr:unnamed protein product [Spirodela intermedia]CAA6665057.1 unnamed protein product [Spirodela intermedia]